MEVYIALIGLGLIIGLIALVVRISKGSAYKEVKLEQAEVLLKDIADANKQARESAKIINAMSDAELNDSLRRKKNK